MPIGTTRILAVATLLLLAGPAAAQAWQPAAPDANPDASPPLAAWPELRKDSTQTWVGIRHNHTDGTIVGLGLRSAAYPSFLLELEVVPPGYGPADAGKDAAPPQNAADNPQLRSIHKLSLRYRF